MLPQHRLGRVLIALTFAVCIAVGALISLAPSNPSEDDLMALAPLPRDTPEAIASAVARPDACLGGAEAGCEPKRSPEATAVPAAAAPTPIRAASSGTQFERVLHPLLLEAIRHRQASAAADPAYWKRIDPHLNSTRLNFLLFGYGETHEPPLTERAFIGSLTVFSYDYATREIDLVSLTHDIRAPEIERYLHSLGQPQVGPIKIDQAYSTGGFNLMRRTLEDATGLAIDFQLAFKESAIAGATDSVFGGLDVDVPMAFRVNAYYLDGQKFPAGEFQKGHQRLTGTQVIQFIKTVPVEEHYDLALEHNARKHLVFRSLMDAMQAHATDVGFLGRAALFFSGQVAQDSIAYDFDLRTLTVDSLRSLMADLARPGSGPRDDSVPSVARTLYVVDPASGDGGVQWVQANAHTNGVTQRDIAQHRYGELAMEVPYHGNPYADDLAGQYWPDVRSLIATRLAD